MIGERLRRARQERSLSLQDVARAADISAATLSRIENSKQALEFGLFFRLAKVLECKPTDLVDDGDGNDVDTIDPIIRKLTALSSTERKQLWGRLAIARHDVSAKPRTPRTGQLAEQVDELLAQVEMLRSEIHALQRRLAR